MSTQALLAPCLFYVVDWLPPDFGPTGQYALVFARELAAGGRQVHVVGLTSGPPGTVRETFAGGGLLDVTRVAGGTYDKTRYISRLLWLARMNIRLMRQVIRDPRSRRGEILFTGSPPFMLFFAFNIKWLRRARLIYRITDFYPEVLIAELGRRPLPLAVLERVTWMVRRRIDEFQALGEDQRRLLIAGGVRPERITLKRDISPIPITGREEPMAAPPELSGRRVLLYSGNYGVAHDVDTVVEGLILHHRLGPGRFALWLNASGVNVDRIEARLRAANVPVAYSKPVTLDQLPAMLAAADVHLITLRSRFSGIVLPSKAYACIASRRPIIFVGPESSDVHLLCMNAPGILYDRIEPGDSSNFASSLERLSEILGPRPVAQT
jgi:Glycosyl transferase 4-like domain